MNLRGQKQFHKSKNMNSSLIENTFDLITTLFFMIPGHE